MASASTVRIPAVLFVFLAAGSPVQAAGSSFVSQCLDKSLDACAVYDTGRLTGTPKLSSIDGSAGLGLHLPAMATAEILILGEVHDNPHHHKLRAALLSKSAIVMEQLRADQANAVVAFNTTNSNAGAKASVADFKAQVGWDAGGWAKYPYDPLLQAVVAARAPVYAGDPPRDVIRKLAKEGPESLPLSERTRLALDRPLGEKLDTDSHEEIEASHCGMLPKTAIPKMAFAQRYRDAHLADATLTAAKSHGRAVLLTGNSHARTDRGVPWYVRVRAPEKKIVSIVFAEAESANTDPVAYVPRDPYGKPAADYVVFTPAATRDDPCKVFAK